MIDKPLDFAAAEAALNVRCGRPKKNFAARHFDVAEQLAARFGSYTPSAIAAALHMNLKGYRSSMGVLGIKATDTRETYEARTGKSAR